MRTARTASAARAAVMATLVVVAAALVLAATAPPASAAAPARASSPVRRAAPSSAAVSRSAGHALRAAPNYTGEVLVLLVPVSPVRGTRAGLCRPELASGPAVAGGDPVNEADPSGLCVSLFNIVCVGGGSVTTTVSLGFNPVAGLQTLADLGAGIGNGLAQVIDSLPGTVCGGATIGYALGIPLCNWVQAQASNYLNLGISIPYTSCGWLGQFQAGEYSFGTAWGEVFPGAVAGDLITRAVGAGQAGLGINPDDVANRINVQAQARHIIGTPQYAGGGYFLSPADAQQVLNDFHMGNVTILGRTGAGQILVQDNNVVGYNNNPGLGYLDQPTNIFIIKGTVKVSVVPTSPGAAPAP
jgi:hypothetical protein